MMKILLILFFFSSSIIYCRTGDSSVSKSAIKKGDSSAVVAKSAINKADSSGIEYKVGKIIKEYLPEVKKIAREKVGPVAKDVLRNDKAMSFTFGGLYEFLPFPLKWVVSKQEFVSFALRNRYHLISQLPERKGG